MRAILDVGNPASWKFGFDLLAAGSHNFGVEFTNRAWEREYGSLPSLYQRAAAGTTPEIVAAKEGSQAFVALVGMRTLAQAEGILASALTHDGANEANFFPRSAYDAAFTVGDLLRAAGFWTGVDSVMVYGHSYGGYVAPAMAYSLLNNYRMKSVAAITYGAPRGASEGSARGREVPKIVRLFSKGDVVPHVAPHVEEARFFYWTALPFQRVNGNKMRHIGYPIRIWDGNDVTFNTEETLAVVPNEINYLSWMYASTTRTDSVHAYSAYWRILSQIPDRAVPVEQMNRSHVGIQSQRSSNAPVMQGLPMSAPTELTAQLTKRRPVGTVSKIIANFTVRRSGVIWAVDLDQKEVALFARRSAAKRYAAKGNSFWRSHGPVNGIDVTSFGSGYDSLIATLRV